MSARAVFRCFATCHLWIFSVVMMRPDLVRNPPVQFLDKSRKADSHDGQFFKFRCRRLIGDLAARNSKSVFTKVFEKAACSPTRNYSTAS